MHRKRILAFLWLVAFTPSLALCFALISDSLPRAVTDTITAMALAAFTPLIPSLPGLLGSSLSIGRSKLSFAMWVSTTLLVEFFGLVLCLNGLFNLEPVASGPVPVGIGPSRAGVYFVFYVVTVSVVYIAAGLLDAACTFMHNVKHQSEATAKSEDSRP